MADASKHTPTPLRGPSFPSISLGNAIEKARIIWDKETRHPVPADVAVGHWKYSPKSSGGKQAIASLLKYGLLEESGANENRRVKLSDRALRALLGSGVEVRAALRDAALDPQLHRLLWDTYKGALPSDETLSRILILDYKLNPSSVRDAIASYKETLEFAGIAGETGENEKSPERPESSPTAPPPPPQTFFDQAFGLSPRSVLAAPPANPTQTPMTALAAPPDSFLPIPLDCGRNALIPRGMSEDDFSLLLDTLNLWKRKIVRAEWPKDAIWHNADHDQPVTITSPMGERDGVKYFRSSTGTGIPEYELEFQ